MAIKIGDDFDNVIQGTEDNDWLQGNGGHDALHGAGGDDTVLGNDGQDVLWGGGGKDSLSGGSNDDFLYGDDKGTSSTGVPGNDTLNGGGGNDELWGEQGNDDLSGGADNDKMYGGEGGDTLLGDGGNDLLYGQAGNDVLRGGSGVDLMWGGTGADFFDFEKVSDSPASACDWIMDFSKAAGDKLDLSGIDAKSTNFLSNDAFTFIGTSDFTGVAGQLQFDQHQPVNGPTRVRPLSTRKRPDRVAFFSLTETFSQLGLGPSGPKFLKRHAFTIPYSIRAVQR